jgi:hypothetical protein
LATANSLTYFACNIRVPDHFWCALSGHSVVAGEAIAGARKQIASAISITHSTTRDALSVHCNEAHQSEVEGADMDLMEISEKRKTGRGLS